MTGENGLRNIRLSETGEWKIKKIYVLHDLKMLDIDLREKGIDIVISGHSHRAKEEKERRDIVHKPGQRWTAKV